MNIIIDNIINDICNFQLVIFGISITLFTVLYSFILTKREELKNINDQIKIGNVSPLTIQKGTFYRTYINKWKKINVHLKILTTTSFMFYIIGYGTKNLPNSFSLKSQLFYILCFVSLVTVLYFSTLLYFIFKEYEYSTKI